MIAGTTFNGYHFLLINNYFYFVTNNKTRKANVSNKKWTKKLTQILWVLIKDQFKTRRVNANPKIT